MNYTAYFDESGTHGGSDAVVVAGFVSHADMWVDFSAHWQMALNDFGVDCFHMSDFANRVKPYEGWTEPERQQRLTRLLGIVAEHTLASTAVVIPCKAFDSAFSDRAKAICGGPYGLAAIACFMYLAETLREEKIDGWVNYVFESGAHGSGQLATLFNANYRDPEQRERLRLLSLRFDDKRLFPLQAADMLAYELFKESPRRLGQGERPARYPLKALANRPRKWGYLSEDELRKWAHILSVRTALEDAGELEPLR